jgi:hypothetical protein
MPASARAYDGGSTSLSASVMTTDPSRCFSRPAERHVKWLSWITLLAGAVMCVVAVLLS